MRGVVRTFQALAIAGAMGVVAGGAAAQVFDAEPRYGSVTLAAGFEPDPYVADVESGGNDDASHLGDGCVGYIEAEAPDFTLYFEADDMMAVLLDEEQWDLAFMVDGDASLDTALLVNDPDGRWYCNDDAVGLHPAVVISEPLSGKYDIWIAEHLSGVFNKVRLLISELQPTGMASGDGIDFGDDESEYAFDGECDDPRFAGPGASDFQIPDDLFHDATDCRDAYAAGLVTFRGGAAQASSTDAGGYGDDSGEYALDGECDDPRFGGALEDHRFRDASDCAALQGGQQVALAPAPQAPAAPPGTTLVSTGTGFFVSPQGHVLTNHHVIEGCVRTVLRMLGTVPVEAQVVSANAANDLALLKTNMTPPLWASFRSSRSIRQGEEVVVYGFPMTDTLSSQGNLTAGLVTALSGMGDDLRLLQISAPVQPGNSGGPLMDRSGNIVGVIVAKIDALLVAQETGDVPQNVNFAIRDSIARSFLDTNNVDYATAASDDVASVADIGERAQEFTGLIECYQ